MESRIVRPPSTSVDGLARRPVQHVEAQARCTTDGGAGFLGEHTVTGSGPTTVGPHGHHRPLNPADIVVAAPGVRIRIGAMVDNNNSCLQPLSHQ